MTPGFIINGEPMPHAAAVRGPSGTPQPLRQVVVFLGLTYTLALAIALALPHAGIAPLISIVVPVVAVVLTTLFCLPRSARGRVWRQVGFGWPGSFPLLVAVLGAVAFVGLSFGGALLLGVVRFSDPGWDLSSDVLNFLVSTAVFGVVFLGEEIGWRGFLLLRLAEVVSGRRAALTTGACHAVFHLPLLVLTTTYQSAGSRWIVVPMVMVTLTMAGVWYAWLRTWSGSIWPVSVSHAGFNNIVEALGTAAIATSPATMAYVTTETGVLTMALMIVVAGVLLTLRAADFEKIRPTGTAPSPLAGRV